MLRARKRRSPWAEMGKRYEHMDDRSDSILCD